jgi:ribosomal protein S18 acetylase RimI-like enzyme
MVEILKIEKQDIPEILDLADDIFKGQLEDNKSYIMSATNWNISVKLVKDDEIIGFYLFNNVNIIKDLPKKYENLFNHKFGIEVVALGIKPEYRGNKYGQMLIDYPVKTFSNYFDYYWGWVLHTLNNLKYWNKRTNIIRYSKDESIIFYFFNK